MAFDYTALANKAQTLVEKFGRPVTFVKQNTTPADPSKPWRGATDPTSGATETAGSGVFVPLSGAAQLGIDVQSSDLVKNATGLMLAALGASSSVDLTEYHEVVDGNRRWRITGAEKLQPATTRLLYFLGLAGP